MEISRIEAVSPRNIDWRRLTAREIIKYNNSGIEVPDVYLQWAKDFIREITTNDVDNTTYDMAQNSGSQTPQEKQEIETNAQADTNTSVTETTDENSAKQKKEELENAGVSTLGQAIEFIGESNNATKETQESQSTITNIQDKSTNEIANLESYMNELLAKADADRKEIRGEIDKVNSHKEDSTTIGKINKLNEQLQQYGINAQATLSTAQGDFSIYEATINDQSGSILNAQDFGAETVEIGEQILNSNSDKFFMEKLIGLIAIKTGTNAQNTSVQTQEIQNQATNANKEHQAKIQDLQDRVQSTTGVAGFNQTQNNNNNENSNDPAEKSAGITETQKAASDNLDQILQSKIRKGENLS